MNFTASLTVRGFRYSNAGSRIIVAMALVSPRAVGGPPQAVPGSGSRDNGSRSSWCLLRERPHGDRFRRLAERGADDERLLEREQRQLLRADARGLALALQLEALDDLVGRDRHLVDAHADRLVDRVRDGGDDRQQRPLAGFLGAER